MNLMEGLMDELNRNRELLLQYKSIGIPGQFGAIMIEQDIKSGEDAIKNTDVVEMLKTYGTLQNNK